MNTKSIMHMICIATDKQLANLARLINRECDKRGIEL